MLSKYKYSKKAAGTEPEEEDGPKLLVIPHGTLKDYKLRLKNIPLCEIEPLHPLCLETVFGTVAKYLSQRDLIACSTLCSTMRTIARSIVSHDFMQQKLNSVLQLNQVVQEERFPYLRKYCMGYDNVDQYDRDSSYRDIHILHVKKLRLVQLELKNMYLYKDCKFVISFLTSQRSTLKSLKLSSTLGFIKSIQSFQRYHIFNAGGGFSAGQLPSLPNLKEISLAPEYLGCGFPNSYSLLELIPNVVKIEFPSHLTKYQGDFTGIVSTSKLKSLAGQFLSQLVLYAIEPSDFSRLGASIGCLRKLRLDVCTDAHLKTILTFMKLRVLKISGAGFQQLSDGGLLGLAPEEVVKLAAKKISINRSSRERPYIGDLKELEKLVISSTLKGRITTSALRFGVLHLPKLQTLITVGIELNGGIKKEFEKASFQLQDVLEEESLKPLPELKTRNLAVWVKSAAIKASSNIGVGKLALDDISNALKIHQQASTN